MKSHSTKSKLISPQSFTASAATMAADFTKQMAKNMASSVANSVASSAASAAATAGAKSVLGQDNYKLLTGALGNVGNAMTDPFEFLKKSWAGMNNLPRAMAPTFDIEELDKRITDMKAVESWLQLNTNMLQGTIKALEIQRGTLATLKDLGASLTPATASGLAKDLASGIKDKATTQNATQWWDMLQQQFSQVTQAAAATMSEAAKYQMATPSTAFTSSAKKPAAKKLTPRSSSKATAQKAKR